MYFDPDTKRTTTTHTYGKTPGFLGRELGEGSENFHSLCNRRIITLEKKFLFTVFGNYGKV